MAACEAGALRKIAAAIRATTTLQKSDLLSHQLIAQLAFAASNVTRSSLADIDLCQHRARRVMLPLPTVGRSRGFWSCVSSPSRRRPLTDPLFDYTQGDPAARIPFGYKPLTARQVNSWTRFPRDDGVASSRNFKGMATAMALVYFNSRYN
jgi:hypothetical protein